MCRLQGYSDHHFNRNAVFCSTVFRPVHMKTTMMITTTTTTTITVMFGKGCGTNIDCYVQFVRNVILCINHVHVVHLNAVHRTVHEYFIPHILFPDSEFYSHSRTEGKANWGQTNRSHRWHSTQFAHKCVGSRRIDDSPFLAPYWIYCCPRIPKDISI